MDAPENSDAFSLDEIRALELERVREEQESERRQREAEQRAREDEKEQERRARAIEDRRRPEAEERAEAELKTPLGPALEEQVIPSLKPRFPAALLVAGTLLAAGTGLVALLPRLQPRDGGVPEVSAQLAAQRRTLQEERETERARMEARIRALQEELEAARRQVASAEAALSNQKERRAHVRPAKAEVGAVAPADPQESKAISTLKVETSVTDPLGGLDL